MTQPTGHPRDLDLYKRRLDRAEHRIPSVLDHLDEQASLIPVLRAAGYDVTHTKGDHPDPTLATVAALERIDYHRRTILDAIATIGVCINMLDDACRDALAHRASIPANAPDPAWDGEARGLCIGHPGMPPEQTCNQHPDEREIGGRTDGRCIDCGRAYDRMVAERDAERAAEANARRLRRHAERRQ